MGTTYSKHVEVKASKKTKVETTYEYVSILGEILGYWRKVHISRLGDTIHLEVNTPLEEWDTVFINGKEIKIIE